MNQSVRHKANTNPSVLIKNKARILGFFYLTKNNKKSAFLPKVVGMKNYNTLKCVVE